MAFVVEGILGANAVVAAVIVVFFLFVIKSTT